jgi:hypothetical protein
MEGKRGHTYNPDYLGGRDQENHSSMANSSPDPILKILNTKKAGGVAYVVKCWPSKALSSKNPVPPKKEKEMEGKVPLLLFHS